MHIKGIRKYPKLYFFSKKYYQKLMYNFFLLGRIGGQKWGRGIWGD